MRRMQDRSPQEERPAASGHALSTVLSLASCVALGALDLGALVPWWSAQQVIAGVLVTGSYLLGRLTVGSRLPSALAADRRHDLAAGRELTTVLFTDIVGSTATAADLGDAGWRLLLDRHDAVVREQLDRFGGREVASTGDGFLATFDAPARGVRCALAVVSAVRELGVEVRAGLHSTEVERRGHDVAGLGVHVGARIAALAGPGEVLVSRTLTELAAGAGLPFQERGTQRLRGVPGEWSLFAAGDPAAGRAAPTPRSVGIGWGSAPPPGPPG